MEETVKYQASYEDPRRNHEGYADPTAYEASYEDPRRNHEGYADPTAYEALMRADRPSEAEEERFHKLLHTLRNVCELSGFKIEGRIVLVDKANGRVWR